MLIGGSSGYRLIEGFKWVDALFMTVITVSTVGFSEVHPLSDAGKIFTSILIFFSLGSIAYIGYLGRFFFDGDFLKYYKTFRVEKRIHRLYNHVIICGYGRNGEQCGKELTSHNTPFVIIDNREAVLDRIAPGDPDLMYINGDATLEDVLIRAGVHRAKALIATTPSDADNVFVVLTARSLNPKMKIISRAINHRSDEKLKRAGADNVIMPELIGGQRMAKLVTQPDVVEFMEYILLQDSIEVSLEEVSCRHMSSNYINNPLSHFKQREISGANIVGLKDRNGRYFFNPGSDYILGSEDQFFVLGSPEQIRMFRKILEDEF
jgi:voltage-gated potassium channel